MEKDYAVMFDLDGTLADTIPVSIEIYKKILKDATGRDFTVEDITYVFGKTEDAMFKYYARQNWRECMDRYLKILEKKAGPELVFDGIFETLDYLAAQGVRMAVVTGRSSVSAEIVLRKTGLAKYFEHVKTGSPEGSIKPQCMREILGIWNFPAGKTFYLGDAPNDVKDSKQAGLTPLSCLWCGQADPKAVEAQCPAKCFKKVEDFAEWIKKQ